MLQQLESLYKEACSAIETASDSDALQAWESKFIGRKGEITSLLRSVGQLPKEERANFGKRANEIKDELTALYTEREELVRQRELAHSLEEGEIDVTLPGRPIPVGGIHPANQTLREIYDIWADMGFQVFRTREVEDDETNFEMLNIPEHHPARDMWDTFHTTTPGVILRTHTSPGQIHAMRHFAPGPIRVILPGMCYRYEQISSRKRSQGHDCSLCPPNAWRKSKGAFPWLLFSVHGAKYGSRCRVHSVRRQGLFRLQIHRLAGNCGLRHGPPNGAA